MNKIIITTDRLDDDSVVVNFDQYDTDEGDVVAQSGYVHVRQDSNEYVVTVYNTAGNVVSETNVPFNFQTI